MVALAVAAGAVVVALWVCCGVTSYLMTRSYYSRKNAEWIAKWGTDDSAWIWTTAERAENLVFAMGGPIALFASWVVYSDKQQSKRAKW